MPMLPTLAVGTPAQLLAAVLRLNRWYHPPRRFAEASCTGSMGPASGPVARRRGPARGLSAYRAPAQAPRGREVRGPAQDLGPSPPQPIGGGTG